MDSMGKDQWFISRCPDIQDTIEQLAAHVYIWYCWKLRRNHFCSEKDSLNCDEKKSKRLNWDEKKAKSTSYSISNRSKPQNGTELFEPLCKHSDSRARRWEQLLRSAKWGICDHFWQLWRLIGNCTSDIHGTRWQAQLALLMFKILTPVVLPSEESVQQSSWAAETLTSGVCPHHLDEPLSFSLFLSVLVRAGRSQTLDVL